MCWLHQPINKAFLLICTSVGFENKFKLIYPCDFFYTDYYYIFRPSLWWMLGQWYMVVYSKVPMDGRCISRMAYPIYGHLLEMTQLVHWPQIIVLPHGKGCGSWRRVICKLLMVPGEMTPTQPGSQYCPSWLMCPVHQCCKCCISKGHIQQPFLQQLVSGWMCDYLKEHQGLMPLWSFNCVSLLNQLLRRVSQLLTFSEL